MDIESLRKKYGCEQVMVVPSYLFNDFKSWTPASEYPFDFPVVNKLRADAELDFDNRQLVCYIVIRNVNTGLYYMTRRIKGDERLIGMIGCVGGHMDNVDGDTFKAAVRELSEECNVSKFTLDNASLVETGTIVMSDTEVDKVHVGLVYTLYVDDEFEIKESEKLEGFWCTAKYLDDHYSECESWVKLLLMNNVITDFVPREMIVESLRLTYIRKNKDYSNSFFKVFEKIGKPACIVRLYDKAYRFENLMKNDTPLVDESVIDTLKDFATYVAMICAIDGAGTDYKHTSNVIDYLESAFYQVYEPRNTNLYNLVDIVDAIKLIVDESGLCSDDALAKLNEVFDRAVCYIRDLINTNDNLSH